MIFGVVAIAATIEIFLLPTKRNYYANSIQNYNIGYTCGQSVPAHEFVHVRNCEEGGM
ncbi:MAG: hypothetical protein PVS3B1_20610 [Ktedonobacteraceae bacterium]